MNSPIFQVTLALFKPDVQKIAVYRRVVENLIQSSQLNVVAKSEIVIQRSLAEQFYAEHKGRFFYSRLVNYMLSGPIGVYILSGNDAVLKWRNLLGPTKVYRAVIEAPSSLRGRLGLTDTRNGFHGSDSIESAKREIALFFPEFNVDEWLTKCPA